MTSVRSFRVFSKVLMNIVISILVASCATTSKSPQMATIAPAAAPMPASTFDNSPEGVVRKLLDGLERNDANSYLDATDPALRTEPNDFFLNALVQAIGSVAGIGSKDSWTKVAFRELKLQTATQDGEWAQVTVTGKIRNLGVAQEYPFTHSYLTRQINGTWFVSDSRLQPTPTPQTSGGIWSIRITRILTGQEAFNFLSDPRSRVTHGQKPKTRSGWQYVFISFFVENTSDAWIRMPYASGSVFDDNSVGVLGVLIDSGGFERKLTLEMIPFRHPTTLTVNGYDLIFPPHGQVQGGAWAEIPENQHPGTLRLSLIGRDWAGQQLKIDLARAVETAPTFFDSMMANVAKDSLPHTYDYSNPPVTDQSKRTRVTLQSVQVRRPDWEVPAITLVFDLRIENIGGDDIRFGDLVFSLVGIDDRGHYICCFDNIEGAVKPLNGLMHLAPGESREGTLESLYYPWPDEPDRIWIGLEINGQNSSYLIQLAK